MTKDVEQHSATWNKMTGALSGITEVSNSSSYYSTSYVGPGYGQYGSNSQGFSIRISDLVKI